MKTYVSGRIPMIRISISYFYGVGAAMRGINGITGGSKLGPYYFSLLGAQNELRSLFSSDWFMPAIRSTFNPGQKLLKAIEVLTKRTDLDNDITLGEAWGLKIALDEFETVLKNELSIADAYFVSNKGAYDTTALIHHAERIFPAELITKAPKAVIDIREGGRCVAFELSTAAGFHVLRATEEVLRIYWSAVSGGQPHPKAKTIAVYLKKMDDGKIGHAKVRAALTQIKDLHRNPLMHPEESLNLDEAISLFGICRSVITAMLKEIPEPVPAAAASLTPI